MVCLHNGLLNNGLIPNSIEIYTEAVVNSQITKKGVMELIRFSYKKLLHSIFKKKFKSNTRDISDIMELIGSYL